MVPGNTVGEVLAVASARYGESFVQILASCRIWVNGDSATEDTLIVETDEVAVLPPVSGGAFDDDLSAPSLTVQTFEPRVRPVTVSTIPVEEL